MPYRLGGDGSDGTIDCINLVYTVLARLDIATPPFNPAWYTATRTAIVRDLLRWGRRVAEPTYDGDVLLLPTEHKAFGVVWDNGILNIGELSQQVQWTPLWNCVVCPCFRTKDS
jgi:hypothetical protein